LKWALAVDGRLETGRGALRHPLFWGALALLVLNDHVWKSAGVLPGALTGKLSDFAGMIVAPVLIAAAFRARHTPARLLAFAAATVPFVAINVFPSAATAMESLVGLVGIEWRIWCDPSDLVGLVALPAAWWALDAEPFALPNKGAVEGVGLFAAAFACMATSAPETIYETVEIPPPAWQTAAQLHNRGTVDVDVRLRWVTAEFACDRIREAPGAYLTREAFGEGVTVTLDPSRNFPLSRAAAGEALDVGADWLPLRRGCDAVLVQRDGSSDAVVFFNSEYPVPVPRHSSGPYDPYGVPNRVEVGMPGRISSGGSPTVIVSPLRTTLGDDSACPATDAPAFAYSGEYVEAGTVAKVSGTGMLRDGCFEVSFEDGDGRAIHSFLCIPMWAFDLTVGDQVRFDLANTTGFQLTRFADGDRSETQVLLTNSSENYIPSDGVGLWFRAESAERCPGAPTACGAYAADMQVRVGADVLHAGDEATGLLPGGRRYRVGIGAVRETIVGIDSCAFAEQRPGVQINTVVFVEEGE